ncbi:PHA/PHB synthase family protein [Paraburkholderia susongensis]|uniref:Polyhydroxyalkanoate synthase n=1 Tax=Paraburkholderia susongensis TaxID=1515439 RepID=A0A1X7M0R0_9BURK|nr:alpha/beta fold hydrolase [Paraburkholderia susongensis]SMG59550.1 polyhydroxyalkanoate synthase [Paraburkholderia susongensis]
MASQPTDRKSANPALAERLQLEVERAVQRGLKGMELLGVNQPAVGRTPKTTLHRRGTLELVHYHASVDEVYRVPILVVMAPTNKGYILDLAPGQSLIEFLLGSGYDVYLIDWNEPTDDERDLKIEDYVLDFIPDCIRRVQQDSGEHDVTLLGYCAGGMLSVIHQSLHVDGPVKNLVCMTTPIDFSKMELFRSLSDERSFDVDRFVDGVGVVPADFVLAGFDALRPASRIAGQIRLWDNLWNDRFVKGYRMMERWGNETLPLPGGYFRQTTKELLQKNALYEGTLRIGGRLVELGKITVPLLHIVAQYDHIVPPACARPLVERAGSPDKEEVVLPGGHVSIAAGANAIKRMWPKLNSWLEERSI